MTRCKRCGRYFYPKQNRPNREGYCHASCYKAAIRTALRQVYAPPPDKEDK
jgi:uncharacterized OB-fold protein